MTILESLILGVVEGVTEFLPISSTGHLILASNLLNLTQSDFVKSFEIIIQFGAILAVIVLYWRSFLDTEKMKRIALGFLPTGVIGLFAYSFIKAHLIGNQTVALWAIGLGGVALILFELWHSEPEIATDSTEEISYAQSLWIGLCQSLAFIPGVSRSAATIVGGLLSGLRRKTIVEFSFLLAVPTMLVASGLDLVKNGGSFSIDQFEVLTIGFLVSFVVALASIRFLLHFIQKHTFIPFGIYRVLLALVFWLVILT